MADENEATPYAPLEADQSHEDQTSKGNTPLALICLGLVALVLPVAAEMIVGACDRIYYPPDHNQMGDPPEYIEAVRNAMMANSAIGYSIYAALLLGAIGTITTLFAPKGNVVLGAILGVLGGAALGAAGGSLGHLLESILNKIDIEGMIKAAAILGISYASYCVFSGFLASLGRASAGLSKAISVGLLTALIGLVIYLAVATIGFPLDRPETMHPISTGLRYVHFYALTIAVVVSAMLMLRPTKKAKKAV